MNFKNIGLKRSLTTIFVLSLLVLFLVLMQSNFKGKLNGGLNESELLRAIIDACSDIKNKRYDCKLIRGSIDTFVAKTTLRDFYEIKNRHSEIWIDGQCFNEFLDVNGELAKLHCDAKLNKLILMARQANKAEASKLKILVNK